MILQNIYEENKVFIDDEAIGVIMSDDTTERIIKLTSQEVYFKEENIYTFASRIKYNKEKDHLTLFYNDDILVKKINEDELISISLDSDMTVIHLFKLPKFMSEIGLDDNYPKFEVNLSDCVYSMRIYLNEYEYIDIPQYQSDNNIHSTLDYICKLVYFLSNSQNLLNGITNGKRIMINIYNWDKDFDNKQLKGYGEYEFRLAQDGIVLLDEEFENGAYLVEWQKFFKLIMDTTWDVEFDSE